MSESSFPSTLKGRFFSGVKVAHCDLSESQQQVCEFANGWNVGIARKPHCIPDAFELFHAFPQAGAMMIVAPAEELKRLGDHSTFPHTDDGFMTRRPYCTSILHGAEFKRVFTVSTSHSETDRWPEDYPNEEGASSSKSMNSCHFPDLSKKAKMVVIGNPGSGKSTLQSLFVGETTFEDGKGSSRSPGCGVTQKWAVWPDPANDRASYDKQTWVLLHTPGLGDLAHSKECAQELTESLKQEGLYILLFVLRADGNRVQLDDIRMLNTVLQSLGKQIKKDGYSVIINKVDPYFMAKMEERPELRGMLIANIQAAMTVKTKYIYLNPADPKLHGANWEEFKELIATRSIVMLPALRDFIVGTPMVDIMRCMVGDIKDVNQEASDEIAIRGKSSFSAVLMSGRILEMEVSSADDDLGVVWANVAAAVGVRAPQVFLLQGATFLSKSTKISDLKDNNSVYVVIKPETPWIYKPFNGLCLGIRTEPKVDGNHIVETNLKPGTPKMATLKPGEEFNASEEIHDVKDNITFMKLADGRGWVFDSKPGFGLMCVRAEEHMQASNKCALEKVCACGKPTWNGKSGQKCSKKCTAALGKKPGVAATHSAPPGVLCGCGKPYIGQKCSRSCKAGCGHAGACRCRKSANWRRGDARQHSMSSNCAKAS